MKKGQRVRFAAGNIRADMKKALDIRPRHEKDYYELFGWLVSKRLVLVIMLAAGVFSLVYLTNLNRTRIAGSVDGIPTYDYDSLALRFAEEPVRIKAEDGHVAYEGDVADGKVTGYGTLYDSNETIVYQGEFDNNMYHGMGTAFYEDGAIQYQGSFKENLFDGSGTLYRRNGSREYEGSFVQGRKEGEGQFYDNAGRLIYTGSFVRDGLAYSSLLGKKVSEISEVYKGQRTLYENAEGYGVVLEDIAAIYMGETGEKVLEEELTVDSVIVMQNSFPTGNGACSTISELKEYFGTADYEGNARLMLPEALAIHWMDNNGTGKMPELDIRVAEEFADYRVVEEFDTNYKVYLYSFHKEGLVYTFVCEDRDADFAFYRVEQETGGMAE